jgi:methionyl-tRNA synthetase
VLTNKYYAGLVPYGPAEDEEAKEVNQQCLTIQAMVDEKIHAFKFRDALQDAMLLARFGNKYLADREPWKLHKTDPEKVRKIMFNALNITAYLADVFDPFLPDTAQSIRDMLRIDPVFKGFLDGHEIGEAKLLFSKIEDEQVAHQIEKLESKKTTKNQQTMSTFEPFKENITFDQFMQLDLRVGTIVEAEKVEKADKLLQLKIDLGAEVRNIVSGIAQHYKPEEIIGKQVTVVCNLEPRKIRGIESKGMVLMAEDNDGKLVFINPDQPFGAGSLIR